MNFLRALLFIVIIFSGWSQKAVAQNYLWPTSASKLLSSSFCEYRPGHYHSAIDIKTWNQEGYPCYAVDDGKIFRVRVSPFGYGKVLYLRLKDGRFAVYAHLQRFSPELEKAVRKQQIKNGRYTIDWRPTNWKVKRGEVIAYTGQTGIGVPHLHFEIRDAQGHPLNPLFFYQKKIKDTIAPSVKELLVVPLTVESRVNGSAIPQTFGLVKEEQNVFRLKEPIFASGKIGFGVRGFDRANGAYNRLGFYQATLFWDEKKQITLTYDTLDFALTHQVDVDIYYPLKELRRKYFHKLFVEPFNELPFYKTTTSRGYLNVQKGRHSFRIVVTDFFGNTTVVKGEVVANEAFFPEVTLARRLADQAFVELTLPKSTRDFRILENLKKGRKKEVDYFEIINQSFTSKSQQMLIRIPLKESEVEELGFKVHTANGQTFYWPVALSDSLKRPQLAVFNMGKYLVARFSNLSFKEGLKILAEANGQSVNSRPQLVGKHVEVVLPVLNTSPQKYRLRLLHQQTVLIDTVFQWWVLAPEKEQVQTHFENHLRLTSFPKSMYDTTLYSVVKDDSLPQLNVPFLSPVYRFQWYPQVFRKAISMEIHYDSRNIPQRRIGIYSLNEKKINLVGAKIDSLNHRVSARIKRFASFVVAADTVPPVLQIRAPKAGSVVKSLKEIRFFTIDSLSGIDSERYIRIFIDERRVIPEWDPERHIVIAHPHWSLKKGKHELRVAVRDRAGNQTQQVVTFTIK